MRETQLHSISKRSKIVSCRLFVDSYLLPYPTTVRAYHSLGSNDITLLKEKLSILFIEHSNTYFHRPIISQAHNKIRSDGKVLGQ